MLKIKESILSFIGLFASLSTIICCALPIILVFLGMGAVFASLTSKFPLIPWLAERSSYLFALAAILLLVGGYFIFLKPQQCPADKNLAIACNKTKRINKIIWWLSLIVLIISVFFKYILILLIY